MSDERETKTEFKERVKEYFKSIDAKNKEKKVERGVAHPYTLPGLAQFLRWPTTKLIDYPEDGKYYEVVEFAKGLCENFLLDAIFNKHIDKALGKMLLETYHGYGLNKSKKDPAKKLRKISDILNDIENNG